jgi:hypothetical protein
MILKTGIGTADDPARRSRNQKVYDRREHKGAEGEDESRMRDGIPQSRDRRMERSLLGEPRVFARRLG